MKLSIREIAIFAMLGTLMYLSKIVMEALPNIHLLAVLTIAYTVVYRQKALYPIYVFVMILGLTNGFNMWWIPHLYLWTILWCVTMLLPKRMPKIVAPIVYIIVAGCHGFLYGTLYAPAQALMFGLDFNGMVAWIIAGLPFDITHGISNMVVGLLIIPIISVIRLAERTTIKS
jgi:energy-coupling factor transport system substrate-specific component